MFGEGSELGAKVDQARPGKMVLHRWTSVQQGHFKVVRCLVEDLDTEVNKAGSDGVTPLCRAADKGNLAND
jgi:ankyrin repeat protein